MQLQLGYKDIWVFPAAAIFKSWFLKMAAAGKTATVMTVEFGTIHYYSSLEEDLEACLCKFLNRYEKNKN